MRMVGARRPGRGLGSTFEVSVPLKQKLPENKSLQRLTIENENDQKEKTETRNVA